MAADELADDEAGQQFLLAAARAAAIVSTTSAPQPASQDLHAEWSEIYIDEATNVGTGAYVAMAEDQTRTPKFEQAIRRRLAGTADLVVLDIGTGPFCLLGLIAARAGAKRVYAVEANADAAAQARAAVTAASDVQPGTVVIVQGFSSDISLPEKCDVLVAEIVGSIASEEGIVGTYRDAQRRLLKAPADPRSYIPQRVQTWCAPASHVLTSLLRPPFAAEDFAARQTGQPVRVGCRDAALQLLSSPQLLEDYDFAAMAAQLPSEHGPSPAAPSSTQPTVPSPLPVSTSARLRFVIDGERLAAAEAVHLEGLAPLLSGEDRDKEWWCGEAQAAALCRWLARSVAGLACWPRLVLDGDAARPLIVRSRSDELGGDDGEAAEAEEAAEEEEEAESHWQTVLPLLSSRPLVVGEDDEVHLEFEVAFGARVADPSRYSLHGELRTTPPTATTTAARASGSSGATDGHKLSVRPTSDGRGVGVFAAEDGFRQGESVVSEPPLLTRSLDAIDREVASGRAHAAMAAAVEACVARAEDRAAFYQLCSSPLHASAPADQSEPHKSAYAIWMANAYPTDEQPTELGSVFRVCSRFNHSCVPNAHIAWNARLRRMAVHALEEIPPGAEVRVSYGFTGEGDTREERQAVLRRDFGFVCACALCSLSGEALAVSDQRQRRIRMLADELVRAGRTAPGECAVDVFGLVQERLDLLKCEGLRTNWDTMAVAMRHARAIGADGEARAWAAKAAESAAMALGEHSDEARRYRQVAAARVESNVIIS